MESVFASADLLAMIIVRLRAARDRAHCRLVCTWWCRVISVDRAPLLWATDAVTYTRFTHGISTLPRVYAKLCADGILTPTMAWELHANIGVEVVTAFERTLGARAALIAGVATREDLRHPPSVFLQILFGCEEGIRALHERLITIEDARRMGTVRLDGLLATRFGISALREGVIRCGTIAHMNWDQYQQYFRLLNNENWWCMQSRWKQRIKKQKR